jgi:hypothetical protein
VFDQRLELSPFALFRRLKEGGQPLLIDVRPSPGRLSLVGAVPDPGPEWSPPRDRDVMLFDDDGTLARERAADLQTAGWTNVRALFGGLDLYEFALDPEVVGAERFLLIRE